MVLFGHFIVVQYVYDANQDNAKTSNYICISNSGCGFLCKSTSNTKFAYYPGLLDQCYIKCSFIIHVLASVWVSSGLPTFIPLLKNMQVGYAELPQCMTECSVYTVSVINSRSTNTATKIKHLHTLRYLYLFICLFFQSLIWYIVIFSLNVSCERNSIQFQLDPLLFLQHV